MSSSIDLAEVNIPGAFPANPLPAVHPEPSQSATDSPAARTWFKSPFSLVWPTSSPKSTAQGPPIAETASRKPTTSDTAIPSSPPLPTPRQPCTCRGDGRNLVVCIDGTSNQFSIKNTNVVELYSRLVKDREKQRTFYNSGIGTYAEQSWKSWDYYMQVIAHNVDLAIAWRFERILLSAYLWLSQNYREGDRIFLFGFSRGAYQVRALSAMIESVGLIHKGNEDQIPFAYQLYAEMNPAQATVRRKARFKQTFSRSVRVHFIGAWDTVSSVGIVRGKTLPGTTDGMKHVCYFRHALALHERRVKFLPEYVRGGLGPEVDPAEDPKTLHMKEVWFAGSHSDIGGGAEENDELDKFGPSLRWMSIEATQFGLLLDPAPRKWEAAKISQSLTGVWKLFEYAPILRLSYTGPEATMLRPHLGEARVIQTGQRVHKSLTEAIELDQNLAGDQDMSRYEVEPDPYSTVGRIYHEKKTAEAQSLTHEDIKVLSFFTEAESGRQLLRDAALELTPTESMSIALQLLALFNARYPSRGDVPTNPQSTTDAAYTVATVLETFDHRYAAAKIGPIARAVAGKDTQRGQEIMAKLSAGPRLHSLLGHELSVYSVAFLPDGRRLVSSSHDRTLRIWDVETGKTVIGPLEGHTMTVSCVAVHGSRIASCSWDGTFRVWDADSGKLVLGPISAHNGDCLHGIAYSRDGTRIATAGDDNRAAVWDANTGVQLREMVGHTHYVMCVAFSEDGTRLVYGSGQTVRVWDLTSGMNIGKPMTGHTAHVKAVCFSLDDKRIFSASYDGTIRTWDAETRALIGEPLRMDSWVLCMALSPDGKRLVAGSYDSMIAMWDAETGAAIPTPFKKHAGPVRSVAFSPDGRMIASASEDKTIALWEATDDWKRWDIDDEDVEKDND